MPPRNLCWVPQQLFSYLEPQVFSAPQGIVDHLNQGDLDQKITTGLSITLIEIETRFCLFLCECVGGGELIWWKIDQPNFEYSCEEAIFGLHYENWCQLNFTKAKS